MLKVALRLYRQKRKGAPGQKIRRKTPDISRASAAVCTALKKAALGLLFGDEVGFKISLQKLIGGKGNERADDGARDDVAWIMHADITA